ncbi:MAG TPA: hypothetical protein VNP98_01010 [Chthoniobacterales bacterium]|nr:hypothetical protein [Chthoniobacterales bacterium]
MIRVTARTSWSRKNSLLNLIDLRERQLLDLSSMILVIRQALEYLRVAEIRKCGLDTVHIASEKEIRGHIMHSDASAFYSRRSTTHALRSDDITVIRRRIHGSAILNFQPAESSFHACGAFVDEI